VDTIIGETEQMERVKGLIVKIAKSDATHGPDPGRERDRQRARGQGRPLYQHPGGQALHGDQLRRLPVTLLETELMGHEKGAFTDAKSAKKGLFELADGGTLFLDEIGDMDLSMQAKLLRVLEEKSFRRVGGVKDIKVDVRVISATNQDLGLAMSEGKFRKDLFYRLQVVPIQLPPLRERGQDVLLLARHFMDHFNRECHKSVRGLTPEAEQALLAYQWPGNVRELKNVIERAMIFEVEDDILPSICRRRSPRSGHRRPCSRMRRSRWTASRSPRAASPSRTSSKSWSKRPSRRPRGTRRARPSCSRCRGTRSGGG